MDRLLTVEETARLLRVAPRTVQRLCATNQLANVRLNRAFRVKASALLERGLSPAELGLDGDTAKEPSTGSAVATVRPRTCRVIAIANQKGGVGKTSITVNLGASLAEAGQRVLVVDVDQQANATFALTGQLDISPSLAEVLLASVPVDNVVRPIDGQSLWLLPGSMVLSNVESHYGNRPGRDFLLRPVVARLRPAYDLILLDCPPSLGTMTVAALLAADELLIPVAPNLFSTVGLRLFDETVRQVRETLGHHELRILGVVINRAPAQLRDGVPRTLAYRRVLADLHAQYGEAILTTTIPETATVEEAHQAATGVVRWRPGSAAAAAYRSLAEEVLANGR